ncbi:MAG: hypothetical protein WA751_05845, partial [Candidatus Dormiibacterota bacterium]
MDLVQPIAHFVAMHHLDAVLSPAHFVDRIDDPWLALDDVLTNDLRGALDAIGLPDVLVYRPLYISSRLLSLRSRAASIIAAQLESSPADGVWLGVHPFGTSAGPLAIRRYIEFCQSLHRSNLPLVGLHTGTVGVLLMALGALSGIESGVTDGEKFDVDAMTRALRQPRKGEKVIGSTPRVYLQTIGAFVTTKEAEAFFGVRGTTGP